MIENIVVWLRDVADWTDTDPLPTGHLVQVNAAGDGFELVAPSPFDPSTIVVSDDGETIVVDDSGTEVVTSDEEPSP